MDPLRIWGRWVLAVVGFSNSGRLQGRFERISRVGLSCMVLLLGLGGWLDVARGASAFTYQGRLVDGGALATGSYELTFRLFNSLEAGTEVATAVVKAAVPVAQGLFTVELDFGAAPFDGSARWLQVQARPAGSLDPVQTLIPRQPITSVPYALRALSGSGNAGDLVSGILPDARLSLAIARTTDLVTTSNALTAELNQQAAGLTALISAVTSLSNRVATLEANAGASLPEGVVMVSTDPADASFLGMGLAKFLTVDAPGWTSGAVAGAPAARFRHTGVWTGTRLLVWGGTLNGGTVSGVGAQYDPALNQWSSLSTLDAPVARGGHTAVWTGESMLVWGGLGAGVNVGGDYNSELVSWSQIPALSAPDAREGHVAVWTGARMLVWGGLNTGGLLADGGLYNPQAKTWVSLPTSGAPEARMGAVAAWTGTHFLVWGGLGESGDLATGGVLPVTGGATPGVWSAISPTSAPSARSGHTAVWTGQRLLVWGGRVGDTPLGNGGSYDPVANSWTPLPSLGAPSARSGHVAVWTGQEMLIVGGLTAGGEVASGGAFNPGTGKWRALSGNGSPLARSEGVGVWTGSEFLVFGGRASGTPVAALQRLNPQPDWYFYRKP